MDTRDGELINSIEGSIKVLIKICKTQQETINEQYQEIKKLQEATKAQDSEIKKLSQQLSIASLALHDSSESKEQLVDLQKTICEIKDEIQQCLILTKESI